jgi:hypothetical protein
VDLRSVFGPNQAYVMLGRVQQRNQLYIIGSLAENKITTDKEALSQLAILKAKSINRNPPVWEKSFENSCKILYHNIHSLKDKMEDIKVDLLLPFADLIIFGETWLETDEDEEEKEEDPVIITALRQNNSKTPTVSLSAFCQNNSSPLHLNGYKLHLNSIGRGKGLALYFKENKFAVKQDSTNDDLQLTILESENLCVVGLYRSNDDKSLTQQLKELIPAVGACLIMGISTSAPAGHQIMKLSLL